MKPYEVPLITDEALGKFEEAYKRAYPHQNLPNDLHKALKRMLRRATDRDESSWEIFISTEEPLIKISADRYVITVEKGHLRTTNVTFSDPNLLPRFASTTVGSSIELEKVGFSPAALTRFAQLFPQYIEDGDIDRSARKIFAKASEQNAISDRLKAVRFATHNFVASRYFRFFQCRFVLIEKEDCAYYVATIEKALWK